MKLTVSYRAEYAYERAVSLSPHLVRLFPRDALHARVEDFTFTTNASADISWRRDLFDNVVASCFYPRDESLLVFTLEARIAAAAAPGYGSVNQASSSSSSAAYVHMPADDADERPADESAPSGRPSSVGRRANHEQDDARARLL